MQLYFCRLGLKSVNPFINCTADNISFPPHGKQSIIIIAVGLIVGQGEHLHSPKFLSRTKV